MWRLAILALMCRNYPWKTSHDSLDTHQQLHKETNDLTIMDAAFVPSEILVKHILGLNFGSSPANHKITIELGSSITSLGKPIRNLFIGGLAIYCLTTIIRTTLQSVLKTENTE